MKVYLNVRINLMDGKRMFTVWPRANRFLPGIEFHTGCAENLANAIHKLKDSLPDVFTIDDEFAIYSKLFIYEVMRPFNIVKSECIRTFITI